MTTMDAGTTHDNDEAQQPPSGTLEHLSPHDLVLEDNVRDDAAIDAEFACSVKEHGVLVPIAAVRGRDGVVRVRAGQRRTVAARQADLPTVPVYVRQAGDGDDKARQLERLAEQIVENDHRRSLTEAQRAKGIQQMLDAGASVTRVARKLSVHREVVKAAATAARSATAMDALGGGQLSLPEAAALTEFEDDPDAVAELVAVAGSGRFDHTLAEIRQRRDSERAYQEAAAGYTARGYTVLADYPGWNDTTRVSLRYLRTADGVAATEEAVTDPAHWAVHLSEDTAYVDKATGAPVDGDDIDWYCRHSATAQPEDGKRHPDTVTEQAVFTPEWFCTDYAAAGLQLCDTLATRAQPASRGDHRDDEASAAARAEAERLERRRTIALNKLGAAAIQVRREFIRDKLLARKTPPKGAAVFVTSCLTRDMRLLDEFHGRTTAAELLGVADVAELGCNGDGRAQVITLGLVLGALEARSPKDAWRQSATGWGHHAGTADLLGFLADNGYPLAPVEEVMTGARSADDVYADTLRERHDPDGDG